MGFLPILLVSLCAISVYIGVNHMVIAFNRKGDPVHVMMTAIAYCSLVILVLMISISFSSADISVVSRLFKYQLFFVQVFIVLLFLLFLKLTGVKQKFLTWIIVFIIVLTTLIGMIIPSGILLAGLSEMEHVLLGTGEKIMIARTGITTWRIIIDTAVLLLISGSATTIIRHPDIPAKYKYSQLIALSIILIFLIFDHTVEAGSSTYVYLLPFAFFTVMMIFHVLIMNNLFRNIRINKSVINSEAKLKLFLNDVGLIVVGLDRMGHVYYINRCFLKLTGLMEDEVMGKDWFAVFLPLNYSYDLQGAFLELEFHPYYQNPIFIKNKEERMIGWYNVQMKDEDGNLNGSLSIGVDITECQAEKKALEEKLHSAEELVVRLQSELESLRKH